MNKHVITIVKRTLFFLVFLFSFNTSFGQTLTLEQYLKIVEKRNYDILIINEDENSAAKQIDLSWTEVLPNINANLNAKHFLKNDSPSFTKNELFGNLQLNQTILDLSKFNNISAQKDIFESVKYDAKDKRERIILEAKKSFYLTLLLKEIWFVKKETEKLALEHYESAKTRFENGLINEFALLQAELQWKRNIPDVSNAKRDYILSLNTLKDLGGISDSTKISISGVLDIEPALPLWQNMKDVFNKRPDYQSLVWEKRSIESSREAVKSEFYPSLNGFLDYSYFRSTDKFVTGNTAKNFTVGLNLSLPIFNGGNRIVRMQDFAIQKEKSLVKIGKFEKLLLTELNSIYKKLEVAKDNIEVSQKNREVAEKAFELASISYENGLATQLDLQDARNGLSKTKIDYLNASFDFLSSKFDWEKAVGKMKSY